MGQDFWKKSIHFSVWDLLTMSKQIENNLFCHSKHTPKLWRTWSLALVAHDRLSHLQFFNVGKIIVSKYGRLMVYQGHIQLSYPWYWFYRWNSSSMLCPSYKNTFLCAANLQIITDKFWCEHLWGTYALWWTQFCV